MPGAIFKEAELPQQNKSPDGTLFPAVLFPNPGNTPLQLSHFVDAIKAHKPWLESLLSRSGAILFRGFPVVTPSDFNDVVEAFGFPEMPYVGGRASRTHVIGRVYTANESPPDQTIPFHHEMAYVPDFPSKLFFFCEVEPVSGGETPLVLSHVIYERMKESHPEFVAKLEEHGLMYIKVMGPEDDPLNAIGNGWKTTFKTCDKSIAEERAANLGSKLEWIDGDKVKMLMGPIPAIRLDGSGERKTWFNSIAIAYSGPKGSQDHGPEKDVEFANGEALPIDAVRDCVRILDEECVAVPWQRGDILLLDNLAVLHSRGPLIKPPRRILASLCR